VLWKVPLRIHRVGTIGKQLDHEETPAGGDGRMQAGGISAALVVVEHVKEAAVEHRIEGPKRSQIERIPDQEPRRDAAFAVRQLGAGPWRLYLLHIVPNIAATLIVSATITFPEIILLESGLSFLGLGVQPPMSSLGNMVGYGRGYLSSAPWIVLAPSLVISLTTLAVSITGDWLRDRLDPTLG